MSIVSLVLSSQSIIIIEYNLFLLTIEFIVNYWLILVLRLLD